MSNSNGLRILAGGLLWMAVYNALWGIAWFALMRKEWLIAAAAIHRPLPWTSEFWEIWIVMTIPIGVAIVAYIASRAHSAARAAVYAAVTLWLLMTLGMAVFAWQESYSVRVVVLDSTVNLGAMVIASLVAARSQRQAHPPIPVGEARTRAT